MNFFGIILYNLISDIHPCLYDSFFLLPFLYKCTTFENYISCNDLILLIVIQKKLSLPPNNHPGWITSPEKRPHQHGLLPGRNRKRKDEKKTNPLLYMYMCICVYYMCTYIYIWREKERGMCYLHYFVSYKMKQCFI